MGRRCATKVAPEAWEVVKFLSNTEAAIDMVKSGGNIPALRSMWPRCRCSPSLACPIPASSTSRWTLPPPCRRPRTSNIVDPILNRHYQTIWNGEKTVEEALNAAHVELQAEMDKLQQG